MTGCIALNQGTQVQRAKNLSEAQTITDASVIKCPRSLSAAVLLGQLGRMKDSSFVSRIDTLLQISVPTKTAIVGFHSVTLLINMVLKCQGHFFGRMNTSNIFAE